MKVKLEQLLEQLRNLGHKKYFGLGMLFVANFGVRVNRFSDPLTGYYEFRSTQTAFGIKSLAENTLNPFSAEMPTLGPPWKVPFEFPLYQLVAALLARTRIFGIDQAGRIISSLSLILVAYLVFKITNRENGYLIGLTASAIILFSSYGLLVGSEVLIDGFAVALALWTYWKVGNWRLVKPDAVGVLTVCCVVAISALVKLNTAAIWVLGSFVLLTFNNTIKAKNRILITALLCISFIPSFLWTSFADRVKGDNKYAQWLQSNELNQWYFGTIRDRLDFISISNALSQFTQTTVGGTICFVVLVFFALTDKEKRALTISLLIVLVSGPLVFIRLYTVHSYYWMAVFPAAVLLICLGLSTISQMLCRQFGQPNSQISLVFLTACLIFSTYVSKPGSDYMDIFLYRRPIAVSSRVIVENTKESDLIIVIGDDWSPATLYFSGRRGLTLRPGAPKPESSELGDLYKYVYSWENNPNWDQYFPSGTNLIEVGEHLYRIGE